MRHGAIEFEYDGGVVQPVAGFRMMIEVSRHPFKDVKVDV